MKKCLIESMQVAEYEQGDPDAGDDGDDAYFLFLPKYFYGSLFIYIYFLSF